MIISWQKTLLLRFSEGRRERYDEYVGVVAGEGQFGEGGGGWWGSGHGGRRGIVEMEGSIGGIGCEAAGSNQRSFSLFV